MPFHWKLAIARTLGEAGLSQDPGERLPDLFVGRESRVRSKASTRCARNANHGDDGRQRGAAECKRRDGDVHRIG
jgi:hypothetical protein